MKRMSPVIPNIRRPCDKTALWNVIRDSSLQMHLPLVCASPRGFSTFNEYGWVDSSLAHPKMLNKNYAKDVCNWGLLASLALTKFSRLSLID